MSTAFTVAVSAPTALNSCNKQMDDALPLAKNVATATANKRRRRPANFSCSAATAGELFVGNQSVHAVLRGVVKVLCSAVGPCRVAVNFLSLS
jgi:hypothetical protein